MYARMHTSPYGSQMCKTHQFDPQMWGGTLSEPKKVSLRSSLCSFSVRNRTGGKPREIAEVCIFRQGTRNGRSICVCAQTRCVHVYLCISACMHGCSMSNVSLLSSIAGHMSEVFKSPVSTQQQHSNNNNIEGVSNEQGGEGGSCINYRRARKNTCDD